MIFKSSSWTAKVGKNSLCSCKVFNLAKLLTTSDVFKCDANWESPFGFLVSLLLILVFCFVAIIFFFKKKRKYAKKQFTSYYIILFLFLSFIFYENSKF